MRADAPAWPPDVADLIADAAQYGAAQDGAAQESTAQDITAQDSTAEYGHLR